MTPNPEIVLNARSPQLADGNGILRCYVGEKGVEALKASIDQQVDIQIRLSVATKSLVILDLIDKDN